MMFSDLPLGATVFLDANTFVYHFGPHPSLGVACAALLRQVQQGGLTGFTSTHILTEVAHRIMTFEACAVFGLPHSKVAQRLRQHPQEIQQLTLFRQAVDEIPNLGVQILSITPSDVSVATAMSQQCGLLSNDALIVAIMQAHKISNLASHDADFDRVPALARYAPA